MADGVWVWSSTHGDIFGRALCRVWLAVHGAAWASLGAGVSLWGAGALIRSRTADASEAIGFWSQALEHGSGPFNEWWVRRCARLLACPPGCVGEWCVGRVLVISGLVCGAASSRSGRIVSRVSVEGARRLVSLSERPVWCPRLLSFGGVGEVARRVTLATQAGRQGCWVLEDVRGAEIAFRCVCHSALCERR